MSFLTFLPMAFVMIAGPQILSAIFLATSEDWKKNSLPFLAVTTLLLALPMLLLLTFGDRAQAFMPKARDWMNNNSWIISELMIGLFIVITINSLAG